MLKQLIQLLVNQLVPKRAVSGGGVVSQSMGPRLQSLVFLIGITLL